jgi:putative nucleotidyltransferase with HDIG domain
VGLLAADSPGLMGATERSLTLLRVFLVASAAILLLGAVVLGGILTSALRNQAIQDGRQSLSLYVDGVLRPYLIQNGRITVTPAISLVIQGQLQQDPDVVTVKVWRPDGVLAWTNRDASRIGKRFELDGDLGRAIRENRPVGSIGPLHGAENVVEQKLGFTHLLQVYAPVEAPHARRAIGAYEIYANPASLERSIASRKHVIWIAVGLVFLVLYAALAFLVRGASSTLRRQTLQLRDRSRALLDSYRQLEESSLEAVESLNATVEAKDPYTAGHSLRVQRVALAIGHELRLDEDSLDALRFGSLFHDIGKIAVPDQILTKPDRLNYWEYAQMKLHSAEGARIVAKFSRLAAAVPLIRHHHERWDGEGYPDGLVGEMIPLEAAVVGLADAWDAMTTDRPYAAALSTDEALEEIRKNRGSQFVPVVVDAFFAATRSRSADLGLTVPLKAVRSVG